MSAIVYNKTVNPLSDDDAFRHASFGLEYVERKVAVPFTFDNQCGNPSALWLLEGNYALQEGLGRSLGVITDIKP